MIDSSTNYSVLLDAFPKLYNDFLTVNPSKLLSLGQVCTFVSHDIFVKSKSDMELLVHLEAVSKQYSNEIQRLLKICLAEFASGFALQKGAIFGFGEEAADDTGTILKL